MTPTVQHLKKKLDNTTAKIIIDNRSKALLNVTLKELAILSYLLEQYGDKLISMQTSTKTN